jgi:hypothetical protein
MPGQDATVYRISPSARPANGKRPSRQTLLSRIRYHYCGNAEGSTLRLTLGCLLAEQLGIELRRVGSGNRMTFGQGEAKLSEWMAENAFVVFHVCDTPWELEREDRERLLAAELGSKPEPRLPLPTDGDA